MFDHIPIFWILWLFTGYILYGRRVIREAKDWRSDEPDKFDWDSNDFELLTYVSPYLEFIFVCVFAWPFLAVYQFLTKKDPM